MSYMVYPPGYVIPDTPAPVILTPAQRSWVKGRIQDYVIAQNTGVDSDFLARLAQDRINTQYSILVDFGQLLNIIYEIHTEWSST